MSGWGVSVYNADELGHLFVSLDVAQQSLGVEHAGNSRHSAIIRRAGWPAAVGDQCGRDHRLARVAAHSRCLNSKP